MVNFEKVHPNFGRGITKMDDLNTISMTLAKCIL